MFQADGDGELAIERRTEGEKASAMQI